MFQPKSFVLFSVISRFYEVFVITFLLTCEVDFGGIEWNGMEIHGLIRNTNNHLHMLRFGGMEAFNM